MSRKQQWIKLDNFRRKEFLKSELKKKILKSIIKNTSVSTIIRYYAFYNYTLLNRSSSVTKVRNRCVETGRKWMIVRRVRYSRFFFRTQSYKGNLPGLHRSSW